MSRRVLQKRTRGGIFLLRKCVELRNQTKEIWGFVFLFENLGLKETLPFAHHNTSTIVFSFTSLDSTLCG
jgi:hypothetical protein